MIILTLLLLRILYRLGWIQSARIQHPLFAKADGIVTRIENGVLRRFTFFKSN